MPYEPWMDESKCAAPDVDPDIYFSTDPVDIDNAKRLCRTCPVLMDCASYALGNREREGLWAGLDMKTLRQEARRIGVPTPRARRSA